MQICVLGTAAGGGLPQWNCRCRQCQAARNGQIPGRMHSSLAISTDRKSWFILNATPDITHQINGHTQLHPRVGKRSTPIGGVLLTDGELDHTVGLLMLRQNSSLSIYATQQVLDLLATTFPVRQIVSKFTRHRWVSIHPNQSFMLTDYLQVTPLPVGSKLPRYAGLGKRAFGAVVAYQVQDTKTGQTIVYAPSIECWDDGLDEACKSADCVFIDGTFWSEEEMKGVGIGMPAAEMGHLTLSGDNAIISKLCGNGRGNRRYLVHINNTNPILISSAERHILEDLGIVVPDDSMVLSI